MNYLKPKSKFNEIDGIIYLVLKEGNSAVDKEDVDRISKNNWYIRKMSYKGRNLFYVYSSHKINGQFISLHRFVMNSPHLKVVDHINSDTLDNQKSNLRSVTQSENCQNRRNKVKKSSIYKGIHKVREKWRASIRVNKKLINIGYFVSEIEAAKAYDIAAILYFGEFAGLNFEV